MFRASFVTPDNFETLGSQARAHLPESKQVTPANSPRQRTPRKSSFLVQRNQSPGNSAPNSKASSLASSPVILEPMEFDNSIDDAVVVEFFKLGKNSFFNEDDISFAARLPKDFCTIQTMVHRKYGTFLSFRLGGDGPTTRRYTLTLEYEEGIAEPCYYPKPTRISTKTEPPSVCKGHIPKNRELSSRVYKRKDNNFAGAYPAKLLDKLKMGVESFTATELQPYRTYLGCSEDLTNKEILDKFIVQIRDVCKEQDIVSAYLFYNMVCYGEIVPTYDKDDVTNGAHVKHYIQESRTVGFIISRIMDRKYNLIEYNEKHLVFSFEKNGLYIVAKLDFTLGIVENGRPVILDAPVLDMENNQEVSKNLEEYYQDYLACHFPVWYKTSEQQSFAPVMVLAGDNGFAISGNMDAEHIAIRYDLPWEARISFNGGNGNNPNSVSKFMLGMLILDQRLRAENLHEYVYFIDNLLSTMQSPSRRVNRSPSVNLDHFSEEESIDEKLELACYYINLIDDNERGYILEILRQIKEQLTTIELSHKKFYSYANDEYYKDRYLPTLGAAFQEYQLDPNRLLTVGQSCINDLVLGFDFDHELLIHGADDLNPGMDMPPIGKTLIYYESDDPETYDERNFACTRDERSYIAFILHDLKILEKNTIDVHPARLLDTNNYHLLWRLIIKIQSLFRIMHDIDNETCFFDNYKRALLENYRFRNSADPKVVSARKALNDIFSEIESIALEDIHKYLHGYYQREDVEKLTRQVNKKPKIMEFDDGFMLDDSQVMYEKYEERALQTYLDDSSSADSIFNSMLFQYDVPNNRLSIERVTPTNDGLRRCNNSRKKSRNVL